MKKLPKFWRGDTTMKPTNRREMTPRQRMIEDLKDYLLAAAIGLALAWVLVEGLSR